MGVSGAKHNSTKGGRDKVEGSLSQAKEGFLRHKQLTLMHLLQARPSVH